MRIICGIQIRSFCALIAVRLRPTCRLCYLAYCRASLAEQVVGDVAAGDLADAVGEIMSPTIPQNATFLARVSVQVT